MKRSIVWAQAALLCLAGCGGDHDRTESSDAAVSADDAQVGDDGAAADEAEACPQADAGERCGGDRYCIDGRCRIGLCGDGVATGAESCDDGNRRAGDGCSATCQRERASCGDGRVDSGEECDDGNLVDQDACNNRCTMNRCGNGAVDVGEECDDGNGVDADSCSNKCLIVSCRNGRLDPGEECDDGNTVDLDQCTNACSARSCGNGKKDPFEDCDDGNTADGDGCPSDCIFTMCGNGIVEKREVCEGPEVTYSDADKQTLWNGCLNCTKYVPTVVKVGMPTSDPCLTCLKEVCGNYSGIDLVSGCFEKPDADLGAHPEDPTYIPRCVVAFNCALKNRCWNDPILLGSGCYCGSRDIDLCFTKGPAEDGTAKCILEWQSAAGTGDPADLMARNVDFGYPLAYLSFLLECLHGTGQGQNPRDCRAECAPWALESQGAAP